MDIHVVSWSQYDKNSSTAYTAALYCSSLYTPWTFSSDTCRKPYIRACVHYPSVSDPSWVLIVAQPWCIWWKHSLCRTQKMKNREEKKNSDQEKKGSSYTSWSGGGGSTSTSRWSNDDVEVVPEAIDFFFMKGNHGTFWSVIQDW